MGILEKAIEILSTKGFLEGKDDLENLLDSQVFYAVFDKPPQVVDIIERIIIEDFISLETAFPGKFIDNFKNWEDVFRTIEKKFESIVECSIEDFRTIDFKHLKSVSDSNNLILKEKSGVLFDSLSNEELVKYKKLIKNNYYIHKILHLLNFVDLEFIKESEKTLRGIIYEVIKRIKVNAEDNPICFYSGKFIDKKDNKSLFYIRKEIQDETKGLNLLGEKAVKDRKYKLNNKSKTAEPIRTHDKLLVNDKDEILIDESKGFVTISELEALYYKNSLTLWSPIIDDPEQSLLAILGVDTDIAELMNRTRSDFLTTRNKELRNFHLKTQTEFMEYKEKRDEEKEKYIEKGKELPEKLKYYLEYNRTNYTPIDSIERNYPINQDYEGNYDKSNNKRIIEISKKLDEWVLKQPKQAHVARKVVVYIVHNINNENVEDNEIFNVTTVADALGTGRKEVRNIYNKIKDDIPALKDLLS